jgi:hypothetical protein
MWAKNGRGLKKIGISLLFLVLVVGNLGAWSFNFGKEKTPEPVLSPVDQGELIALLQSSNESLQQALNAKDNDLKAALRLLSEARQTLASLTGSLGSSKTDLEAALSEAQIQRSLNEVATMSLTDLQKDYDSEVALRQALEKRAMPMWGGAVGTGAVYDPASGDIGVTLDLGIRYESWMLTAGAKAMPDWGNLKNFSRYIPTEYRVGIVKSF